MLSFNQYLSEGSFKGKLYHGSNAVFTEFKQSKARIPNDFYGGGVAYFTSNYDVGVTYAKSMAKSKGGKPVVYEVDVRIKNIFDVDDVFTGQDLKDILPKDTEEFARGAGLLGMNADKFTVIVRLEMGKLKLSGKEVFMGLSKGMNQTAKARDHLISKGYNGLRYNGGENMGMATKHDVYLIYKAKDAKILSTI